MIDYTGTPEQTQTIQNILNEESVWYYDGTSYIIVRLATLQDGKIIISNTQIPKAP